LKKKLRKQAKLQRQKVLNQTLKSAEIVSKLLLLPEYRRASVVLVYLSFSSEVETIQFVSEQLKTQKKILIPYCFEGELRVFWLKDFSELSPGSYGILEPLVELQKDKDRECDLSSIDMVVVPGLGFDSNCRRIGFGKGYYDRFLSLLRKDCKFVGLSYDEQIFPEIPCEEHDQVMDMVITPSKVYSS